MVEDKLIQETITYMVSKGFILRKENIRSFLKVNFDEIYRLTLIISSNAALSLEMIKEIIDTCSFESLFNIEQFTEDMAQFLQDESRLPDILSKNFIKFTHSYMAHRDPERFVTSLIFAHEAMEKIRGRNDA